MQMPTTSISAISTFSLSNILLSFYYLMAEARNGQNRGSLVRYADKVKYVSNIRYLAREFLEPRFSDHRRLKSTNKADYHLGGRLQS